MPIEYTLLQNKPEPLKNCPKCKAPFKSFLRGTVQRSKRFLLIFKKQNYCACICSECKEIVSWESPANYGKE